MEVEISDVDIYVIKFILMTPFTNKLEDMLKDHHAITDLSSAVKSGKLLVRCTVKEVAKSVKKAQKIWEAKVNSAISKFLSALTSRKLPVVQDVWEDVLDILKSVSIPNPEKVGVILEKRELTVIVVGVESAVLGLEKRLKVMISDLGTKRLQDGENECKEAMEIEMADLDVYVLKFILMTPFRVELEGLLIDHHAITDLSSAVKSGKLLVRCTTAELTLSAKEARENWKSVVQIAVSKFLSALTSRKLSVVKDIWEEVIESLKSVSISNPEKVCVILEKTEFTVVVVGVESTVLQLEKRLKVMISDLGTKRLQDCDNECKEAMEIEMANLDVYVIKFILTTPFRVELEGLLKDHHAITNLSSAAKSGKLLIRCTTAELALSAKEARENWKSEVHSAVSKFLSVLTSRKLSVVTDIWEEVLENLKTVSIPTPEKVGVILEKRELTVIVVGVESAVLGLEKRLKVMISDLGTKRLQDGENECKEAMEIEMADLDVYVLKFILMTPFRVELEGLLIKHHAITDLSSAVKSGKLLVRCTTAELTLSAKVARENWKSVVHIAVSKFLSALTSRKLSVVKDIWEEVIESLKSVSISNPEKVCVILEMTECTVVVVGVESTVLQLEKRLKVMISDLGTKRLQDCDNECKEAMEIEMANLDVYVIKFILTTPFRVELEGLLKDHHAITNLSSAAKSGKLLVRCTTAELTLSAKEARENWKSEIHSAVSKFLSVLTSRELSVVKDIWEEVLENLKTVKIPTPEKVGVILEKRELTVIVVGVESAVLGLEKRLKGMISDFGAKRLQDSENECKEAMEIEMADLDVYVLKFILMTPFRVELEGLLIDHHAITDLSSAVKSGKLLVRCTTAELTLSAKEARENWKSEVHSAVSKFLSALTSRKLSVVKDVWEEVIESLKYVSIPNPEKVGAILEKTEFTVIVVGVLSAVKELEKRLKVMISDRQAGIQ